MSEFSDAIQRGTRAAQPSTDLVVGNLYFVTDEGVLERWSGSAWQSYSGLGNGDVVGPGSSTDNAIARFDATTGKLIQNSALTLGDTGILGFPGGVKQTFNPGTTTAGLNAGALAGDPSGLANGDIWYNSSSNALKARINGASVALGAGGGSGALVLLSSQTASASASIDFTSLITSTYDEYLIELLNIVPATTNTSILMRMSTNNGVSFDSGANYEYRGLASGNAAVSALGATGQTAILLAGGATLVNTAARGGFSGTFRLINPLSAVIDKTIVGSGSLAANDGNRYQISMSGWYIIATAVDAIQFLMNSGNIASGIIRLYGIAKT